MAAVSSCATRVRDGAWPCGGRGKCGFECERPCALVFARWTTKEAHCGIECVTKEGISGSKAEQAGKGYDMKKGGSLGLTEG